MRPEVVRGLTDQHTRRPGPTASPDTSHGHLWRLPDRTGLHAPIGELRRDPDTGRVCCHLCGRWFRGLGSHIRAHGYTAAAYRATFGLYRSRPLAATDLSAELAERKRTDLATSPELRLRLERGHEMARSGQLSWLRALASQQSDRPLQWQAEQPQRLAEARVSRQRAADRARKDRLGALGFDDLSSYLRARHAAGASLQRLRAETGLGSDRLRRAMAEAGISSRPQGFNTAAAKRSRAVRNDRAAAERVGAADLLSWLTQRRAAGWSYARLADAVGRSAPWVRSRLISGDKAPPAVGQ